jgi:hypothetical protein
MTVLIHRNQDLGDRIAIVDLNGKMVGLCLSILIIKPFSIEKCQLQVDLFEPQSTKVMISTSRAFIILYLCNQCLSPLKL